MKKLLGILVGFRIKTIRVMEFIMFTFIGKQLKIYWSIIASIFKRTYGIPNSFVMDNFLWLKKSAYHLFHNKVGSFDISVLISLWVKRLVKIYITLSNSFSFKLRMVFSLFAKRSPTFFQSFSKCFFNFSASFFSMILSIKRIIFASQSLFLSKIFTFFRTISFSIYKSRYYRDFLSTIKTLFNNKSLARFSRTLIGTKHLILEFSNKFFLTNGANLMKSFFLTFPRTFIRTIDSSIFSIRMNFKTSFTNRTNFSNHLISPFIKSIPIILFMAILCQAKNVYPVEEFLSGEPEGSQNISSIDDLIEDNNIALVRGVFGLRSGAVVSYASSSSVTVSAGQVVCHNSAGTIIHTRSNTSSTTVTFADLDTGSEAANTTYYVYSVADADQATFTCKLSTSSSAPTGVTYFHRLGYFYNNSSSNIERVVNDYDLGMWEQDSDEVQLKQADDIDMRSMNIINLLDPVDDQDAATKAYVESYAGLADGAVTQTKLATTQSAVSTSSNDTEITLPGGTYGFYPQIKITGGTGTGLWTIGGYSGNSSAPGTSYVTNISMGDVSGETSYAQQRYITASGIDYWLFLMLDKNTKDIISAWAAPDHPSYGNGGDYMKLPHPFRSYDSSEHYIVLIEKEQTDALREEAEEQETDLLTLINENYKVDWQSAPKYVPLHTGKFLGKEPVLVPELPSYIKMKNLVKLTDEEKVARDEAKDAEKEAQELAKQKKDDDKKSAATKLKAAGLTDDELIAMGIIDDPLPEEPVEQPLTFENKDSLKDKFNRWLKIHFNKEIN